MRIRACRNHKGRAHELGIEFTKLRICVNDEQTIVNEIVKLQRKNIVKMV